MNQDASNTKTVNNDLDLTYTLDFVLPNGWTLKERQKFDKKEGKKWISKHIIPYLKVYFLIKNVDKNEKYMA